MKLRDLWLTIHRWLGLGFGLFFFIAALSGAVLVYEQEIDGWINGSAYVTTAGDVGAAQVLARLESDNGARVQVLRWPQRRAPVYSADLIDSDGSERTVRIDPGSGDIAARARPTIPLLLLLRRVHTNLGVGRPGYYVVLFSSAVALISLGTGFILWWPGFRRMRRALLVRTRRGFYPFNYDLHQVAGTLALPLLLVMTGTGVLLGFEPSVEKLARLAVGTDAGVHSWGSVSVKVPPQGSPVTSLELLNAATDAVPGLPPILLRIPQEENGPASVHLLRERLGTAGSTVEVLLDPYDGEVLQVRDPLLMSRSRRIAHDMMYNLHIGAVGGPAVRALYALACVVGAGLVVTGLLIWWLKRRGTQGALRREPRIPAVHAPR